MGDAFSWIEPKSRLRREGDADDEKVLKYLDKQSRKGKSSNKGDKVNSTKWKMENGKILNKKGKWVTPSKRPEEEPLPEDYYEDYDEVLIGEEIPEEELEELVEEIITLRSIDRKEFEDLARSQGTQIALEKFALREYSRKKLGRKLTEKA